MLHMPDCVCADRITLKGCSFYSHVSFCVSRYSIERSSDPNKYFYIEITSGSLMTVRSLDREEIGWHNITVLAMEMSTSHTHTDAKSTPYSVTSVYDGVLRAVFFLENIF